MRTIAIGDIHGCSIALASLVRLIDPRPDDVIVTLGDYIDRGIDSKGVIDQLIELQRRCRLIPNLGNHEQMMIVTVRPSALPALLRRRFFNRRVAPAVREEVG